jgi:hypothetical protein
MNRLFLGLLALGLVLAGRSLDRRRERSRQPPSARPEISEWEGEGGSIPIARERTAAQTTVAV